MTASSGRIQMAFLVALSVASQPAVIVDQHVAAAETTNEIVSARRGVDMWKIRADDPGIVENGVGIRLEWNGVSSRDNLDAFYYWDKDLKVSITAWRFLPSNPPVPVDTYTVDLGWGLGRVRAGVSFAKAEEIAANIRAALLVWSKGVICNADPPIKTVVFDMHNWGLWPAGRRLP